MRFADPIMVGGACAERVLSNRVALRAPDSTRAASAFRVVTTARSASQRMGGACDFSWEDWRFPQEKHIDKPKNVTAFSRRPLRWCVRAKAQMSEWVTQSSCSGECRFFVRRFFVQEFELAGAALTDEIGELRK